MQKTESSSLIDSANRWAQLALDLGWPDQWVEGAIFPCEMVYFLAMAEANGIQVIVESGRQDGFSTIILGEFSHRTGIKIVSIDYEEEVERGRLCREKLAPYPVEVLVGDAFSLVGRVLGANSDKAAALLVDGPKGWSAVALVFASAAYPNVRLLALHNQQSALPETKALLDAFRTEPFYEDAMVISEDGPWRNLRGREQALLDRNAVRSLDRSSLAAFVVPEGMGRRLSRITKPQFKFFQPILVASFWRVGFYDVGRWLHIGSFRIFNSRLLSFLK